MTIFFAPQFLVLLNDVLKGLNMNQRSA